MIKHITAIATLALLAGCASSPQTTISGFQGQHSAERCESPRVQALVSAYAGYHVSTRSDGDACIADGVRFTTTRNGIQVLP